MNFEPVIHKKVGLICKQLDQFSKNREPVDMLMAFSAFAGDVITDYCFGLDYKHLENSGFAPNLHKSFMAASAFSHVSLQFPAMHSVREGLLMSENIRLIHR